MFFLRGCVLFCPSSCGNPMCEGLSLQTNCSSDDSCETECNITIFNYKPSVPSSSGVCGGSGNSRLVIPCAFASWHAFELAPDSPFIYSTMGVFIFILVKLFADCEI